MKYAQKFELKCYDAIKAYFTVRAAEVTDPDITVFRITDVSPQISDLFNQEMIDRGLSCDIGFLVFKKRLCFVENPEFTHIDGCAVSIVIPLEGYEGTHMYWCEGDFHLTSKVSSSRVTYAVPIWADSANVKLAHREVIDSPTICRVDIPHDTVTRTDDIYRVVLTTRFAGDPSFEEVCEKLLK